MASRASNSEENVQERASPKTIALAIAALFQTAPIILATYNSFPSLAKDHVTLFGTGIVVLSLSAALFYKVLAQTLKLTSIVGFVFTFIAFTAYIDLMLALCLLTPNFNLGRFYLDKGERYFNSTYGFICLFYDGVVQFLLEYSIAVLAFAEKDYHFIGLVWGGSVLNSMAPLLFGAAIGPFSDQIQLSMALNVPYVFFPIGFILYLLSQSSSRFAKAEAGSRVRSHHALTDIALLGYNFFIPIIHIIRVMCVMGSKAKVANVWRSIEPTLDSNASVDTDDKQNFAFMAVQVVQWAFWFVLFHWAALFEQIERIRSNKRSFLLAKYGVDLSAIILGGYMQSTSCYLVTAYFDMDNSAIGLHKRAPAPTLEFLLVNLATLICAVLHFVHFHVQDVEDITKED